MKTIKLFECHHIPSDELLCYIRLTFIDNATEFTSYGRIESLILYNDQDRQQSRLKQHKQHQTYYRSPDGEDCMGISRFSLPYSLRGLGLGTALWSEFYKGLPKRIQDRLIIFGSLTSVDAFSPELDSDRKPIITPENGQQALKLMNQIERRNRFWSGMLLPLNINDQPLRCDESGNGGFKGFFKDPLYNKQSQNILLHERAPSHHTLPKANYRKTG